MRYLRVLTNSAIASALLSAYLTMATLHLNPAYPLSEAGPLAAAFALAYGANAILGVSTYDDFRVEPERFLDEAVRSLGTNGISYPAVERANGKAHAMPTREHVAEDEDDLLELVEADLVKN